MNKRKLERRLGDPFFKIIESEDKFEKDDLNKVKAVVLILKS